MYLLLTAFQYEPQHLTRGTVIAYIHEIGEASEPLTLSGADTVYDAEARRKDVDVTQTFP